MSWQAALLVGITCLFQVLRDRLEEIEHSKNKTPVLGDDIPVLGVKRKRGWYLFWLFFKIGLCSAITFKRSRRELSNDVAEHRSMLKSYLAHYPRFSFNPHSIPRNGGLFLLYMRNLKFRTKLLRLKSFVNVLTTRRTCRITPLK